MTLGGILFVVLLAGCLVYLDPCIVAHRYDSRTKQCERCGAREGW